MRHCTGRLLFAKGRYLLMRGLYAEAGPTSTAAGKKRKCILAASRAGL